MEIIQTKIEKNVASVEVIVTRKEIDAERDHAVDELSSQVTVKGFRQGKAPKTIAEQHLNQEKVTDHVLNHLLSEAVSKTLSEYKYNLLGRPILESVDTKGKTEWKFSLNFPLYPEVALGDYRKMIQSAKKTTKTKKETLETKDSDSTRRASLDSTYQALLKGIEVDIPSSVIEEEVAYSLERLTSQAKSLNLTMDKYLQAINRTMEQVKEEYRKSALESLKLDFILLEIAKKENIEATQKEIEDLAKSAGIPENQHSRLNSLIQRRKTIDFLSAL